jgi:F-type H+-transporting ATPase subunit b
MYPDWSTLALQTVNFAVLVWLLHRFLYRPVLSLIDARKKEVQQQSERVKTLEEQVNARLADLDRQRRNIVLERESALKSAATRAEEAAQARRVQVERDAKAIVDSAHETVEAERDGLLAEARRVALDLATDFAHRLIAEMPAALCADAWIERIERHLQTVPKPELMALAGQLTDGRSLILVTPAPIPQASLAKWRARLEETLGTAAPMTFEVNPDLVAGAELHFPDAVLDFSGRGALATLRSQIDFHDNTH